MSSKEAFFSGTEVVPASDAIGRVSADTPEANEFLQANDPCAFRTCTRWRRERRHVSHPGHDLSRAIDAMTLPTVSAI